MRSVRVALAAAALGLAGLAGQAQAADCPPGETGTPPNCFGVRECPPGYGGYVVTWGGAPWVTHCAPDTGGGCGVGCVPDTLACPILAQLHGTSEESVLEFGPDGDIDVAGGPFWDCPPYATA